MTLVIKNNNSNDFPVVSSHPEYPIATMEQIMMSLMEKTTAQIYEILNGLKLNIKSRLDITYDTDLIITAMKIKWFKNGNVYLKIPAIYILQWTTESFTKSFFQHRMDTPFQRLHMRLLLDLAKNPQLAENAKRFAFYHEFCHVILNTNPKSSKESKKYEKLCDTLAVFLSGEIEGAKYLFSVLRNYPLFTNPISHPSADYRLRNLQKIFPDASSLLHYFP